MQVCPICGKNVGLSSSSLKLHLQKSHKKISSGSVDSAMSMEIQKAINALKINRGGSVSPTQRQSNRMMEEQYKRSVIDLYTCHLFNYYQTIYPSVVSEKLQHPRVENAFHTNCSLLNKLRPNQSHMLRSKSVAMTFARFSSWLQLVCSLLCSMTNSEEHVSRQIKVSHFC